jgi:hypothetical protein
MVRVRPGEVYGVAQGMSEVLHFKVGRTPVFEHVMSAGGPISLTIVPGYGVVVGTTVGEVLTSSAGVWGSWLGASPNRVDLNAVAAFQDGFVAGGTAATLTQYTHGSYCMPFQPAAFNLRVLQPIDNGILMLGDYPGAADATPWAILHLVPP